MSVSAQTACCLLLILVGLVACGPNGSDGHALPQERVDLPRSAVAYIPTRQQPLCAITRVVDGDTVHINCTGASKPVRLTGYDTPETYQAKCAAEKALGEAATRHLANVLSNATVIAPRHEGVDKYGRDLASLIVDGKRLADLMIRKGYAVRYDGGRRIDWCNHLAG